MRYIADNDLHIHSMLSSCSADELQTTENILKYAQDSGFKTICVTDHFWDDAVEGASQWYKPQNYEHIVKAKPLPQAEGVRFLFGCETEMDKFCTLGISKEKLDLFDFIIVPTTHFHMGEFALFDEQRESIETLAQAWIKKLDALLNMDLPFKKMGIAHLLCSLIQKEDKGYLKVAMALDEGELKRLFTKAAKLGVGIELNQFDMNYEPEDKEEALRIFKIAKSCGCKFYLGSDGHHPDQLYAAKERFEKAIDDLGLTEEDKFILA